MFNMSAGLNFEEILLQKNAASLLDMYMVSLLKLNSLEPKQVIESSQTLTFKVARAIS